MYDLLNGHLLVVANHVNTMKTRAGFTCLINVETGPRCWTKCRAVSYHWVGGASKV
jgi:hypothetical protein